MVMPSSLFTISTRAPRSRCASYTYITEGKFRSSYTILLRFPPRSKQDRITDWQTDTFWCITTDRAGAPMTRATASPAATGMSHQPSAHARTPRRAQTSEYSARWASTPRGIAPREWLTRYVQRSRIGNSLRQDDRGSVALTATATARSTNV